MIPRRAKNRDSNEPEIIKALRKAGCSVLQLDTVDLLVGRGGANYLLEVKDGEKPPSKRKLTEREKAFIFAWRGRAVKVVTSVEEALAAVDL